MQANLTNIPQQYGIYIFKNWADKIIYVGSSSKQAGGIRKRIKQHFSISNPTLKIDPFEIAQIGYLSVDTKIVWWEEQIVAYLYDIGHPLRNLHIRSIHSDFSPDILAEFKYVPVWDNENAREIALKRESHRLYLLEGIAQIKIIS